MKFSLYARLAAQNIRKNRRLYVPYLLSGLCMVMITYILGALTDDPAIRAIPGGDHLSLLLTLGIWVMLLFSLFFLLYTSSFLMKQRNRELSLYNMLGMSKMHVAYIVFFETLFCALLCVSVGLALGVLLSKAFQLALLRLTGAPVAADFTIEPFRIAACGAAFALIFLLIFLRSASAVARMNPVELMRESRAGEKPPRSNVPVSLLGVLTLGTGYVLALCVKSALDAFSLFFAAVLLVIIGTYLCFGSGSVLLLRLLQANANYYYKPNHFISVSGMRYRMKRSGDSLATICILSTMVLVVLSSVTCLYAGTENALVTRYPRQIAFTLHTDVVPARDTLRAPLERALTQEGVAPQNVISYRSLSFVGHVENGELFTEPNASSSYSSITVIPLEDYNALCGTDYTLAAGEALAAGTLLARLEGSLALFGETYAFAQTGIPLPPDADGNLGITESLLLIVPSAQDMQRLYAGQAAAYGSARSDVATSFDFDADCTPEEQIALAARLNETLAQNGLNISYRTREGSRADFTATNIGLLFLGVMLSAAFLCAAVLSMYYKQITEGYEDQSRYEIMRKVGLSRRMIRQSVNSQMLTVFLLPLIAAGLHTAFAFPMLVKLLMLFGLVNTRLFALTALSSFGAFSLLYVLVYAITSRTYYKIVSGPAA